MPATVTYAKIIKKGKEGGMLHLEKLSFKILFIFALRKKFLAHVVLGLGIT